MAASSKKPKTDANSALDRIRKARTEGRSQTALDLAKALVKDAPTPENQALYRDVMLERAQQLMTLGFKKEAVVVYSNAAKLDLTPEQRLAVVESLAALGEFQSAASNAAQLGEGAVSADILGKVADAAMSAGPAGRETLPEPHRADFDAALAAFAHAQRGEGDAARAELQKIGLQSPLLEWRVLLRGLLAYWAGDDARATENWARLNPKRLPWRIAAPFRFEIDDAFRQLQPVETVKRLKAALGRLVDPVAAKLQAFATMAEDPKNQGTTRAFDCAEAAYQALRGPHPDLALRVLRAVEWYVADKGTPRDLDRLSRMATLPDDPHHHRLRAIISTRFGAARDAVAGWLAFAAQLSKPSDAFPAAIHKQAVSMVLEQLGDTVDDIAGEMSDAEFKRLKAATAEKCYRDAIVAAPTRKAVHEKLLDLYDENDPERIDVLQVMAKHLPRDPGVWGQLGDALMLSTPREAISCYETQLSLNPLDAKAKEALAEAHWAVGESLAKRRGRPTKAKDPEQYRTHFEQSVSASTSPTLWLAQWAMFERNNGHAEEAAALVARIAQIPNARLAAALAFLALTTIAKKKDKSAETQAFQEALAAEPSVVERLNALELLASLNHKRNVPGRANLVKQVAPPLPRSVRHSTYSEDEWVRFCRVLLGLRENGLLRPVLRRAEEAFPDNPWFRLFEFDLIAAQMAKGGGFGFEFRMLTHTKASEELLSEASALAKNLPRAEYDKLVPEIEVRRAGMQMLSDMVARMRDFGNPFEDFDDEEPW